MRGEERKQEMQERRGEERSKRGRKLLGSRSTISHKVLSAQLIVTQHKVKYAHIVTHIPSNPLPSSLALSLIPLIFFLLLKMYAAALGDS